MIVSSSIWSTTKSLVVYDWVSQTAAWTKLYAVSCRPPIWELAIISGLVFDKGIDMCSISKCTVWYRLWYNGVQYSSTHAISIILVCVCWALIWLLQSHWVAMGQTEWAISSTTHVWWTMAMPWLYKQWDIWPKLRQKCDNALVSHYHDTENWHESVICWPTTAKQSDREIWSNHEENRRSELLAIETCLEDKYESLIIVYYAKLTVA